jgi:hypothetical protein
LVAALEDLEETYEWGCSDISLSGSKEIIIGAGYQNTMDILSENCQTLNGGITAASASNEYFVDSYSDWYLPSKEELLEMSILDGFENTWYWSSTEYSETTSYESTLSIQINPSNGSDNGEWKYSFSKVRPIRSFGNWTMGCMDETACNFTPEANMADGSCEYPDDGYDCEGNITAQIGEVMEGGYLFYIDSTGKHGLVAASEDLIAVNWGCSGASLSGADSQTIGSGYQNSLDIVAECSETPIAASEAIAYESEGYSDWYLPSIDELNEMYSTIGNGSPEGNIGGFSSHWYWSSSETDGYSAWLVNFSFGGTSTSNKDYTYRVRFIRAF